MPTAKLKHRAGIDPVVAYAVTRGSTERSNLGPTPLRLSQ